MSVTVVLMGVSRSGKSTVMRHFVDRFGWDAAEGDDFHPKSNVDRMRSGQALTDADRWPWLQAIASWIETCEAANADAIVTCSALRRVYRDLLRDGHPSVRFVHLRVNPAILRRRLEQRDGHYMPASLLDSQLATLEPLHPDEPGFEVSGDLPPEAVVSRIEWELRTEN